MHGPERPKHVAFIHDIIKGLLCLTVIYMSQHNGMDSMKKKSIAGRGFLVYFVAVNNGAT